MRDPSSPLFRDDVLRRKRRAHLEPRLRSATQLLDPIEDAAECSTPGRRAFILATAEMYRLAALLYLLRVCPLKDTQEDHRTRLEYLARAVETLAQLDVATSPWPLFVFACEAYTDDHRLLILRTLDRMNTARRIGNLTTISAIVETVWNRQDLAADRGEADWLGLVTGDTAVPWFV